DRSQDGPFRLLPLGRNPNFPYQVVPRRPRSPDRHGRPESTPPASPGTMCLASYPPLGCKPYVLSAPARIFSSFTVTSGVSYQPLKRRAIAIRPAGAGLGLGIDRTLSAKAVERMATRLCLNTEP